MKNNFFSVAILLFFSIIINGCASTQEVSLSGSALLNNADQIVKKLQQGGYVIYFRHAITNWQEKDTDRRNLKNCDTQRKLSLKGQAQAQSIGEAFEALKLPVGEVFSSPYCRCLNTGKLAFGKATLTFDLKGLAETERNESNRRVNVLKNMLATTPPAGRNTILISHSYNINNAANFSINEGDAVVFEPLEEQGFRAIATITADQWTDLARTLNMLK